METERLIPRRTPEGLGVPEEPSGDLRWQTVGSRRESPAYERMTVALDECARVFEALYQDAVRFGAEEAAERAKSLFEMCREASRAGSVQETVASPDHPEH